MAAEETTEKKNAGNKAEARKPDPVDQITVTRHRARIGARQLAYTVTCGTMVIGRRPRRRASRRASARGRRCSSSPTPSTT
jgi:hypothetical protein